MSASEPIEARNTWLARSSRNGDARNGNPASTASNAANAHRSSGVWSNLRSCTYPVRKWPLARGTLDTVELLARTKQPPWPHHQHRDQHSKRHDLRQQWVDVVDEHDLCRGHDQCANKGA